MKGAIMVTLVAATALFSMCENKANNVKPSPEPPYRGYFYATRGKKSDQIVDTSLDGDNGQYFDFVRRRNGPYDPTYGSRFSERRDGNEGAKRSLGFGNRAVEELYARCYPYCQEEKESVSQFRKKFFAARGKKTGHKEKFFAVRGRRNADEINQLLSEKLLRVAEEKDSDVVMPEYDGDNVKMNDWYLKK